MNEVKLISCTQGAGELQDKGPQDVISYVARVSNPHNQQNFDTAAGLLKYCIKHEHWSIFETVSLTMEINTNRGIAAQILRHRSFTFQEFSQRYASTNLLSDSIPVPELRRQDTKNRQNSINNLPPGLVKQYNKKIEKYFKIKKEKVYSFKKRIDKFGSFIAFFSWMPILGDILTLSLGFFRVNIKGVFIWMFIGRSLRFIVIAYLIYNGIKIVI